MMPQICGIIGAKSGSQRGNSHTFKADGALSVKTTSHPTDTRFYVLSYVLSSSVDSMRCKARSQAIAMHRSECTLTEEHASQPLRISFIRTLGTPATERRKQIRAFQHSSSAAFVNAIPFLTVELQCQSAVHFAVSGTARCRLRSVLQRV